MNPIILLKNQRRYEIKTRSSKKKKEKKNKCKEKAKGNLLEVLGSDTREIEAVRAVDQKQEEKRPGHRHRRFVHRSRSRFHFDGGGNSLFGKGEGVRSGKRKRASLGSVIGRNRPTSKGEMNRVGLG